MAKRKLEIVYVDTESLKAAEYNPNVMDKREAGDLKKSVDAFGLVEPLVVNGAKDRQNVIIGGHNRWYDAQARGEIQVPVVYIDIPDIIKEQELNVRLNKNRGHWNWDVLANFDTDFLKNVGFQTIELDKFLKTSEDNFDAQKEYSNIDIPDSVNGRVYELGRHRLMCGDSTNPEHVATLMGDARADLVFTDPPYNVDYDYNVRYAENRKKRLADVAIFSDKKSNKDFAEFIRDVFQNAYDYSKDHSCFYCWHATKTDAEFRVGLIESGWHISQTLIWLKENITFSTGQDYHRIYEPCFFGWKRDKKRFVNKEYGKWSELIQLDYDKFMDQLDVVYQRRDLSSTYEHPTQKPVRLAERALQKHSLIDFVVLDLFGGSGSTMVACEQLNRVNYSMELDPKFCDVIRRRYARTIGKEGDWKKITKLVE